MNPAILSAFYGTIECALTDSAVDTSNATIYTFSGKALGVALGNRKIVVCTGGQGGGGGRTLSSVTVGGVTATITKQDNVGATTKIAAIVIASVPTGTTGDIVITWSGSMVNCAIAVFRLINANITATASGSDITLTSDAESLSIATVGGGVTIGAFMSDGNATPKTTTWTNMTEQTDTTIESTQSLSTAFNKTASTNSSVTITATGSGTLDAAVLVVATYKPL